MKWVGTSDSALYTEVSIIQRVYCITSTFGWLFRNILNSLELTPSHLHTENTTKTYTSKRCESEQKETSFCQGSHSDIVTGNPAHYVAPGSMNIQPPDRACFPFPVLTLSHCLHANEPNALTHTHTKDILEIQHTSNSCTQLESIFLLLCT